MILLTQATIPHQYFDKSLNEGSESELTECCRSIH